MRLTTRYCFHETNSTGLRPLAKQFCILFLFRILFKILKKPSVSLITRSFLLIRISLCNQFYAWLQISYTFFIPCWYLWVCLFHLENFSAGTFVNHTAFSLSCIRETQLKEKTLVCRAFGKPTYLQMHVSVEQSGNLATDAWVCRAFGKPSYRCMGLLSSWET